MPPIVECVPNFSEGRDDTVTGAIADAIAGVPEVTLLDVDKGWGANRTVMTFVGQPDPILEGAFQAIKAAAKLIDMRYHRGAHPRLGATDVCPFVPIAAADMQLCAELANRLGARVSSELDIPVFLYGEAATRPERKLLPDVRRGEYEGLISRFQQPGSEPDFGSASMNETAGATIIGARKILIAFNVNLNTKSKKVAAKIAANIREAGRIAKDLAGNALRSTDGMPLREHGSLKACRAVGWYVEEYDCAQVSTNLIDFHVTSLHDAYDEVCKQAESMGVEVTGAEVVGLVPLHSLLLAGEHYAKKLSRPLSGESELVELAVASMGLRSVRPFDVQHKVLEYRLAQLGVHIRL